MSLTTEILIMAAAARKAANQPIWDLIDKVRLEEGLTAQERDEYLTVLYSSLTSQDIREIDVYNAQTYDVGVSYRASIVDLQRTKKRMQKMGVTVAPGGNPKMKDRAFASALGIPVPKTYHQNAQLSEVTLVPNSFLKPMGCAANSGVFYVDESLRLHSLRTRVVHDSTDEALQEVAKYRKNIFESRWILEEAILAEDNKPARDFKVFCFYGVSAMFQEVDRFSYPQTRHAMYDEDGRQFERGRRFPSFPGTGLPDGIREMTRTMSLASPVPVLRFDYHLGENGLYLGEITPHAGGTYATSHSDEIDKMLGHYFADAKARLYIDLLNGKQFPEYREIYGGF